MRIQKCLYIYYILKYEKSLGEMDEIKLDEDCLAVENDERCNIIDLRFYVLG